jgi:hypothetical protein
VLVSDTGLTTQNSRGTEHGHQQGTIPAGLLCSVTDGIHLLHADMPDLAGLPILRHQLQDAQVDRQIASVKQRPGDAGLFA